MFKEINRLEPFFEASNREFNVREIARLTKIVPATASKALKYFAKNGILKHRRERFMDLYSANLENDSYKDIKKYYSITKTRKSGIIDSLNTFYGKPTIILFGSVASGLDIENSDLDLVIVSEKKKEFPDKATFEKKLKKSIHLFVVTDLRALKNPHLINNVINGIVLQGELKWI